MIQRKVLLLPLGTQGHVLRLRSARTAPVETSLLVNIQVHTSGALQRQAVIQLRVPETRFHQRHRITTLCLFGEQRLFEEHRKFALVGFR